MRVAYVCMDPGVPVFGQKGASVHVQEVIRSLLKRGAKVELFALRLGGECPSDLTGVRVHTFPDLPKADTQQCEQLTVSLNQMLRLKLASSRFDVIYERYSLWSYAAMDVAKAAHMSSVLEVNAPLIEEQEAHRSLHDKDAAVMVAARVFGSAGTVICVSEQVAQYVRRYTTNAQKVHVLPNGVNLSRFAVPPAKTDEFTVGFVGTLKPWHGVEVLLGAFRDFYEKHSQSRLLVVGDGPEREKLEANVKNYQLENFVTFTGAVSPENVPQYLAQMTVAVAPYPALENFYFSPLKILEYMAAGVPVVASRAGQIPELIEDGVSGILCPPGDRGALTLALCDLYQRPALAERLARQARKKVEQQHSWDVVVDKMLSVANVAEGVGA